MSSALTKRQLARVLACKTDDAYTVADRFGIPYDERHGVDSNGRAIVRRVYSKVVVDAALDERGRLGARRAAS